MSQDCSNTQSGDAGGLQRFSIILGQRPQNMEEQAVNKN